MPGLALFLGEFFAIGAEMWAAKYFGSSANQLGVFAIAFGMSIVAALLLMYGYTYGYHAFKSIWIVTAISISGILVVEPIAALIMFRQLPELGASIAFVLAVIGIILTLVLK